MRIDLNLSIETVELIVESLKLMHYTGPIALERRLAGELADLLKGEIERTRFFAEKTKGE
jgi:hypothetical protein